MQDRLGKLAPEHLQAVLKEVSRFCNFVTIERRIQSGASDSTERP